MNYEQKYKEALNDVRTIYPNLKGDAKLAMEHAFPELAESEDERIRKGLIEALKTSKTVGELKFILPEPTREECIAYLEKQKEQKHPNGCFTCDEYKKGYEAGRSNGFTAGYNKAMKEQKPAEWSDTNELVFKDICKHLKEEGYGGWIMVLEALHNGEFKQPVTEWSEEDKKLLDFWLDVIDRNDWRMDENFCKASREFINRLKSLRPSWKPNEEQEEPEYYQHFDPDC